MQRGEFLMEVKYNLQQRVCDLRKFAGFGIRRIVIVCQGNRQHLHVASI